MLHNAQLATTSSLLQRDLQQVVGTLSAGVEMQARAKRGEPSQVLQVRMEPIATKLVALFNVSTNYEFFLATALIPALVHILAMTAGAWGVGHELRDRTFGQWLASAHSGWATLAALLGKLAIPAALLWGSGMLCLLYLSLRTALSGAGLLSAPAFAFSGVGFPLLSMSASARGWAQAMPYTHYARLQMEQWQIGAPIAQTVPVVAGCASLLGWWLAERERALHVVLFTSIPLAFMGGFTWPVEALPEALQWLRWLSPSTAGISASLRPNQTGAPVAAALQPLLWLAALAVVSWTTVLWLGSRTSPQIGPSKKY